MSGVKDSPSFAWRFLWLRFVFFCQALYDNAGKSFLVNIFACFKYLIDYNDDFWVLTWSACCAIIATLCEKGSTYFMDKRRTKRGFTLVELIVVLVILALLAALLVPALTGYMDKARKSQVIAETRMITMAVQTKMSEYYASSEWNGYGVDNGLSSVDVDKYYVAYKSGSNTNKVKRFSEITSLAEVTALGNGGSFGACVAEDGRVTVVVYKDGKGMWGFTSMIHKSMSLTGNRILRIWKVTMRQ